MKKILLTIIAASLLVSCYTDADKHQLQVDCRMLSSQKTSLQAEINGLSVKVQELETKHKAYTSGREPRYIVKFQIKQGTFTLSIGEHIKNAMNAIEVEFPVTKDYYNRLSIGQDLTDSFKWGSLIMDGDFSNLHMRVTGKRIE